MAKLTRAQRKRARSRAAQAALLARSHKGSVHYTQGAARWSGIARRRNSARGDYPTAADCSAFATWCLWNALYLTYGEPDTVNGARWQGGFTGTQIAHGRRIAPSKMLAGDLVFYGSGSTPTHVAICVGKRDGKTMVVSHGSEAGPLYLPWNYRRVIQCRRYIHTGI